MLASIAETFAVVLIVAAAIGYLSLRLRKSISGGGCCRGGVCRSRTNPGDQADQTDSRHFVPRQKLADQARRHATGPLSSGDQEPT